MVSLLPGCPPSGLNRALDAERLMGMSRAPPECIPACYANTVRIFCFARARRRASAHWRLNFLKASSSEYPPLILGAG